MKSKRLLWGMVIGLIACLAACKKEQPQSPIPDSPASLQKLFNPAYQISTDSIHRMIRSYLDENKQVTPWDSALVAYYQEKDEFFWLNDSLVSDKPATQPADSLLYWLGNISKHGIHPGLYLTDSIRNDLEQIRTLQLQGKKTMNRLLADVEYRLTSAYLSYVCRLKFGFLPPERRWNDSIDRIPLKRCDKEFALAALDSLRIDANAAFRRAQPSSRFYKKMHNYSFYVGRGTARGRYPYRCSHIHGMVYYQNHFIRRRGSAKCACHSGKNETNAAFQLYIRRNL